MPLRPKCSAEEYVTVVPSECLYMFQAEDSWLSSSVSFLRDGLESNWNAISSNCVALQRTKGDRDFSCFRHSHGCFGLRFNVLASRPIFNTFRSRLVLERSNISILYCLGDEPPRSSIPLGNQTSWFLTQRLSYQSIAYFSSVDIKSFNTARCANETCTYRSCATVCGKRRLD